MKSSLQSPLTRLFAGLVFVLCASCSSMRSGIQGAYNSDVVGRIAQELVGSKWANCETEIASTEYAGRFTVLVFFDPAARDTASCLEEVVAFHNELQPRGVVFFGVTDTDAQRLGFFLEENPLPFPILTEAPEDRMQYGIKKLLHPEVILVDPYARIVSDELKASQAILGERLKS